MLEMSSWERRKFGVLHELKLDAKNVRLGLDFDGVPPQGDIIQDLFQTEGAFDIARAIVTVGFFTHELPVVIREDDQWIVVEGNRRTAALKALLNPFQVPGFQARITRLIDEFPLPGNIEEIECLVAPDRDSANQLIAMLHTSNPRKGWGPLRQADFFSAQLRAGKTVEELILEYPGIDVADFVETAEMQTLLQSALFTDPDLEEFVHRKTFPISTFERLYKNPEFLKLAKLAVDKATGHVTLAGNKAQFDRLSEKIVGDIKIKKIDTRVLNTPDIKSYKDYMHELAPLEVSTSKSEQAVAALPQPQKPKSASKPATRLSTTDLFPVPGYPATERLILELSKLPYRDFPNATFDFLRTFLEKSIKAYAASLNEVIPPKKPGAFVFLDDALQWLGGDAKKQNKKALASVIQKLRTNKSVNQYQLTKEYLDAANHNHEIFITKDEVKDLWDSVIGLMRYVLRDRT
jgi:hypothetical protein